MLNYQQEELKDQLTNFINSKDKGFFGVLGAGGTGKTYTICQTIKNPKNVLFLGATNKVCGVLKQGLINNGYTPQELTIKTIDSFLSFKMKKDHNNRTVITRKLPAEKNIPNIIVIDEVSLIHSSSFEYLMKLKNKRKFILIGDDRQIPPIEDKASMERNAEGFQVSKIFNQLDWSYTLTIQQRQKEGSQLKALIAGFRDNMHRGFSYQYMAETKANNVDIFCFDINSKELKDLIRSKEPMAVCFKNLTCLSLAWVIGSTRTNNKGYRVNELNAGDKVFFDGYYRRDDTVFYTSEEVIIRDIEPLIEDEIDVGDIKPAYYNYKKLLVEKDDGSFVIVYSGNGYNETLQPIKYRIDRVVEKLNKQINLSTNNARKWILRKQIADLHTSYEDLKIGFATLKKTFSITAHKSQGSTYDDVLIPIYDFASRIPQDSAQLLYVAMSRAKKNIYFITKKSNFKDNNNRYSFTEVERMGVASLQNFKCNICNCDLDTSRDFDVDHAIPLANGGRNTLDNLQALCKECHKTKTINEKYERTI